MTRQAQVLNYDYNSKKKKKSTMTVQITNLLYQYFSKK